MLSSNVDRMPNYVTDLEKVQELKEQIEQEEAEAEAELQTTWSKVEAEPEEAEAESEMTWDEVEAEWFDFGTEFLIF